LPNGVMCSNRICVRESKNLLYLYLHKKNEAYENTIIMTNLTDDKIWNLIVRRIEEEKCILILGPEVISKKDTSINDQLKEHLDRQGNGEFKYYTEDEFFSFTEDADKEYAFADVQDFYNELQVNDIYSKIVEIPFHLIISLSPDLLIKKTFEEQKTDCLFDFYNKEENPQAIGKPNKQKPLVYNLFGNIEKEGSLILTYDDLFEYLLAIFGKHELHQDLRREIKNARTILFIGFRYEKWYFKLITRLLNVHNGKLNHAPLKDRKLLPDVKNFYTDELKVNFLNYCSEDIIDILHSKCEEKNSLRTKIKKTNTIDKPEIYVSYAWGGESEKVTEDIINILTKNYNNVIRDKEALGYKGNIKDFMQQIGRGKYVVVIISDKYLKSENCMNEMLEIKNDGNTYERIFPIVLNDAKIYDEIDRIDYLNYWDDKLNELKEKVKTLRDPVGKARVHEKINQYADINRIIDEITDMLRNMNTLTPEMHKDSNFQPMSEAINKQIEQDNE